MRPVPNTRGFSLIEAIAAIVILGVAMPSMLAAIASAHRARVTPVMASQARWLAIERMEDVIADRASPERGWEYVVAGNYPLETEVPGAVAFTRSVRIIETGADLTTPGEGYKSVNVTVSWTHESKTLSVSFDTVLTERS